MKLALYLPNFRDKVTVSEIVDVARLAEELEFDSIWTLDRIVVPEASDRQELRKPFGFMKEFPNGLPVIARGEWFQGMPLVPYLAGITKKIRIGTSVIDTPYRPWAFWPRRSRPGTTWRAEESTWVWGRATDNLKRYKEAGLTLPLLWPPFRGVPTAKTIVDLRRLKEDILPKVG